ncbi:Na(+)/H(+) exchange regulatory cofactor NHE-RF1 [Malaya genurostris]|uniref:Na(+)/H(+) exchange regulatory cofactor NHE-RF1 n=1 Tax=Malaya genurostris TaxID=325434 RepID=UPI0026F3A9BD|nr:Na(+)/H(+) exchange regulatory cofactor NHE-RF1 [Malaya genurostris]XP_058459545.1 Na(+)/H(+) exchange regulatory cofactor NHE-RF1 [Malaya genurostris]XP_058459547.1 Na(+)/H(+) exchange regulatory cofactor NHE-RF1 [Malaya genurostris]
MSTKNSSTTNGGTSKYEARLCHVVKRPDFDGYGFNLHAEKGRPGQYIGKVDDGSPAEAAGLRQGDRIIEVNGTNITNETHKKVVELIKSIPNETKLLVIDPRADANELKAAAAAAKSKNSGVDVNDNSKQTMSTNRKDSLNEKSSPQSNRNKHDVNGSNGNEDANNKRNSSANNNHDTGANKMMLTNGDTKKQQPVEQIIEDTKSLSMSAKVESNGKPMANANGTNGTSDTVTKDGPKLNLNMTAAELRAQLAARKKYDPKNDVCDLRKKYEIIQKM